MLSRSLLLWRPVRPVAVLTTLTLGLGLLGAGQAGADTVTVPARSAAVAAPTTGSAVNDATFTWGLNRESGSGAFFGGCNFLVAGKAGNTGSSRLWSQADGFYRAAQGNVSIEKAAAGGTFTAPDWASKCKDADGTTVTTGNNKATGNRVVITHGTGTVDPAANTASITWDGDFSVVYYGGLTYWSASDPTLTVNADGTGKVTATASGYGADMNDPDKWVPLAPTTVELATLSGVQVGPGGISVTPDYLGVAITNSSTPQPARTAANESYWGAFPQSFVDFQVKTGQAAYWYASGGARDTAKPADTLGIGYTIATVDPGREIDHATFEWGANLVSQGGSPAGGCGFFVAGKSDGTDATYKTEEGAVHLFKRLYNGAASQITQENRCLPVDGAYINQRILFSEGKGNYDPETGAASIAWTGAATLNYYGGLVPFYIEDPVLTVDAAGKGAIVAKMGGFASSMDNPGTKVPLTPETNVHVADLTGVKVVDGKIVVTPDYQGVDYFPLNNATDPNSGRETVSAVPDSAKAANPEWGAWPTSFVDFQYRSGLSSYFHTSGLSADPMKPPLPVTVTLDGSVPNPVALEPLTITTQPVGGQVVIGENFSFSVAAQSATPLKYQWQRRAAWGAPWVNIDGATNSTVTLNQVPKSFDGSAIRAVVANGSLALNSAEVGLAVAEGVATTAVNGPFSIVKMVDQQALFTFNTRGFPTAKMQWQRSTDQGASWKNLGEPAAGTYRITNPTLADNGALFRAIATNGIGAPVTSPVAKLTVQPAGDGPTIATYLNARVDVSKRVNVWYNGSHFPTPAPRAKMFRAIVEASAWPPSGAFTTDKAVIFDSVEADINITAGSLNWVHTIPANTLDPKKKYGIAVFSADPDNRHFDAFTPIEVFDSTAAADYTDVSATHPFVGAINWLSTAGIADGFADGGFHPAADVERMAVVAFLYRATNPGQIPTKCVTAPFTDIPVNHQFCGYITWAKENGLTTGNSDGTFRPNSPISREAQLAFLYRLQNKATTIPACTTAPFPDVATSNQFCGAISWAKTAGITTGFDNGTFRPGATVQRDTMAAFLFRQYGPKG
ncbi:hypothetical protein D1871_19615 [Nakamurella silvestris]|nr:hypothetical protein D1871_19615 [Nakamurella silvestris]